MATKTSRSSAPVLSVQRILSRLALALTLRDMTREESDAYFIKRKLKELDKAPASILPRDSAAYRSLRERLETLHDWYNVYLVHQTWYLYVGHARYLLAEYVRDFPNAAPVDRVAPMTQEEMDEREELATLRLFVEAVLEAGVHHSSKEAWDAHYALSDAYDEGKPLAALKAAAAAFLPLVTISSAQADDAIEDLAAALEMDSPFSS